MTPWIRTLLPPLAGATLTLACAGCRAPGVVLCPRCRRALQQPGRPTRPTPAPAGLPPVTAVAAYEGVVRSVLLAHKEHGRLVLAAPLGAALAASVLAAVHGRAPPTGSVALVPVPSHRAVVGARGHDPLLRLTHAAARVLRDHRTAVGQVNVWPMLRLARRPADQAGLSASERRDNVMGSMQVRAGRAGRAGRISRTPVSALAVVLVDDIVTTGATVAEAARALREAGVEPAAAAVVAATVRVWMPAVGRGG